MYLYKFVEMKIDKKKKGKCWFLYIIQVEMKKK